MKRTASDIARVRHISEVLVRNGLGFLVERTGLARFGRRRAQVDAQAQASSVPERVRRTLEELGPTYIKLGQIASTRPDLLPPEYIVELSRLLDAAQPVPVEEVRARLEEELGAPLEQYFARFEEQPIASASIGQVHRATLHDGTAVVVKVQRPGVERIVQADLNLLNAQARFLAARSATLQGYGVAELVEEFSHALRSELDYAAEGRNIERLERAAQAVGARVPRVYWELTTRRVITLSDLGGLKLSQIKQLQAAGHDLREVAARIVTIYLRLVFEHGIFHGDPHPANILIADDGTVGLVDFGVVGYLTPQIKDHLGGLLLALVQQDADAVVRIIVRMGAAARTADQRALQRDVHRLLLRYYDASLASVPIAEFLSEVMAIAFKHRIRLPSDLALLARTVIVLEGVARSLDPSLVLASHLRPFVLQLVKEPLS
ncbi:MAG: AarF/ABC1/UbiB kinase family protein, partial [Anaerolineae bacterium]|nr:AarF/ABC1/UbiB kinase family protein [Anaerolineae bacterium]